MSEDNENTVNVGDIVEVPDTTDGNVIKGPAAIQSVLGGKGLKVIVGLVVLMIAALVWSFYLVSSDGGKSQQSEVEAVEVERKATVPITGNETETYIEAVTFENNEVKERILADDAKSGEQTMIVDVKVEPVIPDVQGRHQQESRYGLSEIEPWQPEDVSTSMGSQTDASNETLDLVDEIVLKDLATTLDRSMRAPSPQTLVSAREPARNPVVAPVLPAAGLLGANGETNVAGTHEINNWEIGGFNDDQYEMVVQGMQTVAYAVSRYALNSDVPSDVVLEIVAGPLRGSVLRGEFEKLPWVDLVRIKISQITLPDGTDLVTEAIVLDPATTLAAIDGDVDHHYLYRYGWWGLGTMLTSIGDAIERGSTSVTSDDGVVQSQTTFDSGDEALVALGGIGEKVADIMQAQLQRPVTVSLPPYTEMGVFFLKDIVRTPVESKG